MIAPAARPLDRFIAARHDRALVERLLDLQDWPEDRALSLELDRLVAVEEEAAAQVSGSAAALQEAPARG